MEGIGMEREGMAVSAVEEGSEGIGLVWQYWIGSERIG